MVYSPQVEWLAEEEASMGRFNFDITPGRLARIIQIQHASRTRPKAEEDVVIVEFKDEPGLIKLRIPADFAGKMNLVYGQTVEVALEGDGRAFINSQAAVQVIGRH